MTGKLDRIEALMTTLGPPYRFSDQMWHQISHDTLALVEIAKAAQRVLNAQAAGRGADWLLPDEVSALRAALARLEDNQ